MRFTLYFYINHCIQWWPDRQPPVVLSTTFENKVLTLVLENGNKMVRSDGASLWIVIRYWFWLVVATGCSKDRGTAGERKEIGMKLQNATRRRRTSISPVSSRHARESRVVRHPESPTNARLSPFTIHNVLERQQLPPVAQIVIFLIMIIPVRPFIITSKDYKVNHVVEN